MSKITQYLNEHILGEVTASESVRKQFACDGSLLSITPEIIVYPRITNDIRKVARFTWQLAEKGHILPITVRGEGSDQTGASIGKGIIINTVAHLSNIIYINLKSKDQFVHVQPGVNFKALNEALKSHGMIIPAFPPSEACSSVGGSIANNSAGPLSGQYGQVGDWVKRLELVLANGDLIETTRISRRDLDKKKGLQTFEGEIYRKIDGIIEDNQQLIDEKISLRANDNAGYSGIAKVKQRDGSFDLTPLVLGSQGTLGIVSEAVLRTDFYNSEEEIVIASFKNLAAAQDAATVIEKIKPVSLDLISGSLFTAAKTHGKKFQQLGGDLDEEGIVMFICINDFSHGARRRKLKQILKRLSKFETNILTSTDHSIDELYAIKEVTSVVTHPELKEESIPPIINGASVSPESIVGFLEEIKELSGKHHLDLPMKIQWLNGIVDIYPRLQLNHVSDKQRIFKLMNDYMGLVARFGGSFATKSAEGRLKSTAIYSQIDSDIVDVYTQIRSVFDPFGTLNPGVKQANDLKTLVSQLNPNYSPACAAKYSPR